MGAFAALLDYVEKTVGLGPEDQSILGIVGLIGLLLGFLMGKVRRRWREAPAEAAAGAANPAEAYKKKIRSQAIVLFSGLVLGYYAMKIYVAT